MKLPTLRDSVFTGLQRLPLFAVWCAVGLGSALADDRVALVVGNAQYPNSPLFNTQNDANAMADLLSKAGFKVDRQIDTSLSQLQAAVDRFGTTIRDPKVKFGVFYYAGHGVQQDWHNFLIPVSAKIRVAADVAEQTVDVSRLLHYMEQAQGRNFLVVLDACRDDPFAGDFRPPTKGLSQFDAPVGSLLAFATAPGSVSADGTGKNGLYTGHLLREFAVPGVRVEDAFKRVRLNVRLASKGAQIPWESTSLEEDISIFPVATPKLSEAERDELLEREMTTWLRIKGSNDPDVLAGFIREYPSGSASELAQSRMNRMMLAMATQENQRLRNVSINAAGRAQELAAREDDARKLAQQAEEQRQAATKVENERLRSAQLDAEQQKALLQRAADEAAAQAEKARVAKESALAAAQEAARLGAAREEAERQNRLKAEPIRSDSTDATESYDMAGFSTTNADLTETWDTDWGEHPFFALKLRGSMPLASNRTGMEQAMWRPLEQARMEPGQMAQTQQSEAARAAAASALAVEQEARRVAAIAQELALQSELQAQAAAAHWQHLATLQAKKQSQERTLAAQAQKANEYLADRVAQQQLAVAHLAAERQALLAATETTAAPAALTPTPFFKGSNEHVRHFSVGDQASVDVVDVLTKIAKRKLMLVTGADLQGDRITYNNGEYVSDLMGNTTANLLGSFSTPRQFYPAELMVGNKWKTRFKQSRPNGITYTFQYDVKVVGKEKITVPAGTFEAYKIEARGFNMELNASVERNIWVTPGINADIAHEIKVRLRDGQINQYDREELVSFMQAKQ